jgi:hypothetical protein
MIKEIYVVFGCMNTGSASLTYPEDFETVGFYEKKEDAQAHVDRLNEENGTNEQGEWLEEDQVHEHDYYDGMVYTVETLQNLQNLKV